MKGVWKWSLGLSLGLLAGGAPAQEGGWRAAAPQPGGGARPAASLARPVAQAGAQPAASPAATLSRPVAADAGPRPAIADTQLQPASFSWPDGSRPAVLARAQSPEGPKPMPVGPPPADEGTLGMPNKVTAESGPVPAPAPVPAGPATDVWGFPAAPGAVLAGPPGEEAVVGDGGGACCVEADSCCAPEGCCADACHHFWINGEYLMWWFKNSPAPPLLTGTLSTGPAAGTLADPGARILFGEGGGINTDTHSGARFSAGYWFDDQQCWGVDGSFFVLGQRGIHSFAGSGGVPGLYRPFFSPTGAAEAEEVAGLSPARAGVISTDLESRLWGAEADLRYNLLCGCWYRLDLVGGLRFVGLDESLQIAEEHVDAAGGGSLLVVDRFRTSNKFYGGQVGALSEFHLGRWFVDVNGKVALGSMHQVADIAGVSSVNGGPPIAGGLLAQSTNSGHFGRDRFAVVPELGLNVGYQVTDALRFYVGYNFLYMSSVIRPGDQIDQVLSRSTLPPSGGAQPAGSRPLFAFHGTDFWAHGVNFGLEWRY
jgi:hypothetical protein